MLKIKSIWHFFAGVWPRPYHPISRAPFFLLSETSNPTAVDAIMKKETSPLAAILSCQSAGPGTKSRNPWNQNNMDDHSGFIIIYIFPNVVGQRQSQLFLLSFELFMLLFSFSPRTAQLPHRVASFSPAGQWESRKGMRRRHWWGEGRPLFYCFAETVARMKRWTEGAGGFVEKTNFFM